MMEMYFLLSLRRRVWSVRLVAGVKPALDMLPALDTYSLLSYNAGKKHA